MSRFGFTDTAWDRAKDEGRRALIEIARRQKTISYSDLVARISAIALDPHSYAIRTFLNEISTAEHNQGAGLLSVVVVYKHGDQMPGPGFFELAKSLGYHFRDETEFWIQELHRIYRIWLHLMREHPAEPEARRRVGEGSRGDEQACGLLHIARPAGSNFRLQATAARFARCGT